MNVLHATPLLVFRDGVSRNVTNRHQQRRSEQVSQVVDSVFVAHPKMTRHSEPWQWAHMRLTYEIRLAAEVITASAKNPLPTGSR